MTYKKTIAIVASIKSPPKTGEVTMADVVENFRAICKPFCMLSDCPDIQPGVVPTAWFFASFGTIYDALGKALHAKSDVAKIDSIHNNLALGLTTPSSNPMLFSRDALALLESHVDGIPRSCLINAETDEATIETFSTKLLSVLTTFRTNPMLFSVDDLELLGEHDDEITLCCLFDQCVKFIDDPKDRYDAYMGLFQCDVMTGKAKSAIKWAVQLIDLAPTEDPPDLSPLTQKQLFGFLRKNKSSYTADKITRIRRKYTDMYRPK